MVIRSDGCGGNKFIFDPSVVSLVNLVFSILKVSVFDSVTSMFFISSALKRVLPITSGKTSVIIPTDVNIWLISSCLGTIMSV